MPNIPSPALMSLLKDAGYQAVVRTDGWCELYLQRDKEIWIGHGLTEDEALAHLFGQMFPSHLARSLLDDLIRTSAQAVERITPTIVVPEAATDIAGAAAELSAPPSTPELPPLHAEAPVVEPEPEPLPQPEPVVAEEPAPA